jgi:DNA-binding NarL/FixJ family response regulator
VSEVAAATDREQPDLAFVGLGTSGEHALEMISEIVHEASCPVIALLESGDPEWVNEAAKRGIFAYIVDGDATEMQSVIDITLRRYSEYANLEGAFGRRAVIERAKGIMMSRQEIDEQHAFELLRGQSRGEAARSSITSPRWSSTVTCCSCSAATTGRRQAVSATDVTWPTWPGTQATVGTPVGGAAIDTNWLTIVGRRFPG